MGADVLNVLASSERRGAETFAYDLHKVLIGRGVRSAAVSLVPGVSAQPLPVPALGDHRYSPAVVRALRRLAADSAVVVGHGSSTLLACAAATFGLKVPFVYVNIGDPRHWASTWGRRLRVRLLLRHAAAVAAISPRSRDVLISEFGLAPERVWVIANARSAALYRPATDAQREAARARLGLPASGAVLASVGALSPEKRVDVAVRAMAELPEATLLIAGDGPQRRVVEELAMVVAPGRVHVIGPVQTVADVLAATDVLVLSSDSEGVPGILIEAGLGGIPAVATDVGFVRDVVVPGDTGEVVPPGQPRALASAVGRVLPMRETYGARARAHCLAHFEIETVADRWQELLERVRGAGRPADSRHRRPD